MECLRLQFLAPLPRKGVEIAAVLQLPISRCSSILRLSDVGVAPAVQTLLFLHCDPHESGGQILGQLFGGQNWSSWVKFHKTPHNNDFFLQRFFFSLLTHFSSGVLTCLLLWSGPDVFWPYLAVMSLDLVVLVSRVPPEAALACHRLGSVVDGLRSFIGLVDGLLEILPLLVLPPKGGNKAQDKPRTGPTAGHQLLSGLPRLEGEIKPVA